MNQLIKICSIIYRLVLVLIVPANLLGNLLAAIAGHNRNFSWVDYLMFGYLLLTAILLTLYYKIKKRQAKHTGFLFYVVSGLVFMSIVFQLYQLYDIFFICRCFSPEENVFTAAIFIFLIISSIVFIGLIKKHKYISLNKRH